MSDVDGTISQVEVFNGTTSLGLATVSAGIWSLTRTLADGPYNQLKATATDNSGATTNATNATSITVDTGTPTVSNIVRADADPTDAGSVAYTVTFSENVTGVDVADFALGTTGVSGASISNVSGSGTTYTVTVNTGSGDGTIRLHLADDDSVRDAAGNRLGGTGATNGNFTGEAYTLDRTAPVVQGIALADADPTNDGSVEYTVTFSNDVTGVDLSDFGLTTTGVTGASVQGVSQFGSIYTVTVNTGRATAPSGSISSTTTSSRMTPAIRSAAVAPATAISPAKSTRSTARPRPFRSLLRASR